MMMMVHLRGNFINLHNGYKSSNLIPSCCKKTWAKAMLQFVNFSLSSFSIVSSFVTAETCRRKLVKHCWDLHEEISYTLSTLDSNIAAFIAMIISHCPFSGIFNRGFISLGVFAICFICTGHNFQICKFYLKKKALAILNPLGIITNS